MSRPETQRPQLRLQDLLAVPFAAIRVPLSAVDRQLVQRLHRGSATRTVLDCALGTLDILAGHLLGEEGTTRYGVGRVRTALHPAASDPPALRTTSSRPTQVLRR